VSTHEESIIEQEELGREVELKGRVAVGEGNPVGYSASLNTGASALVALLCIGIFSRGVLQFRFVMFVAVSLAAILPVAIATGTRGLLVSIVGVGGIMAILVRMRHRPVLHQIIGAIVFLFAFALIGRFVLPWFLSGISTWIEHVFGPGQGYYLQNLASLLEGTELGDQSTDSRRWLWSLAWDFIVQYPILGMPTDRYYEAASQGFYAHNYFLEQWNIAGFAGFACAIGLVFAVARAAYVLVNASDLRVYVVGMVHTAIFFGFLIQSQFSFTLFQGRMMFLAAGIVIGLELAERKKLSAVRGAPKPTLVRQGDTP
jgi:O-antigen ligase